MGNLTPIILDATGLLCPMPVIKLQNLISTLEAGQTIKVHCTDPGAAHDIPAWCRVHGHSVNDIEHHDAGSLTISVTC